MEKNGRFISEYFYRAKLDDPTANFDWEYILIDKKVRNAWCMSGGKIAFYTGMLDVTKYKWTCCDGT